MSIELLKLFDHYEDFSPSLRGGLESGTFSPCYGRPLIGTLASSRGYRIHVDWARASASELKLSNPLNTDEDLLSWEVIGFFTSSGFPKTPLLIPAPCPPMLDPADRSDLKLLSVPDLMDGSRLCWFPVNTAPCTPRPAILEVPERSDLKLLSLWRDDFLLSSWRFPGTIAAYTSGPLR